MSKVIPPERRRSVLVINQDDRKAAMSDRDLVELFDETEGCVIVLPDCYDALDPLQELLRAQGLLRRGVVAVQSPYNPERYVEADAALVEFAAEKLVTVTLLAKALGATKVRVTDVRAERSHIRENVTAKANAELVTGEASVERAIKEALERQIELTHTFEGGAPDREAAEHILTKSCLTGDIHLSALIEMRSGQNLLTQYDLRFSGTQESAANLRSAVRISEGLGKLKLAEASVDLSRQVERGVKVEFTTHIQF